MYYICMTQMKSLSFFEGQDARYIGYDKFGLSSVNLIEFKPFFIKLPHSGIPDQYNPSLKLMIFLDRFKRVC